MGRHCTVCRHPDRNAIDLALFRHQQTYDQIASRYGLVSMSLRRHQENHLRLTWDLSKGLRAMLSGDNLLEELSDIHKETRELMAEARQQGDIRTALMAIRESRSNLDSYHRITHDIKFD